MSSLKVALSGRMVILGTFCGVRHGLGYPLSLIYNPGAWFGDDGVHVHLVVESLKHRDWLHLDLRLKGNSSNGTGGRCHLFPLSPQ